MDMSIEDQVNSIPRFSKNPRYPGLSIRKIMSPFYDGIAIQFIPRKDHKSIPTVERWQQVEFMSPQHTGPKIGVVNVSKTRIGPKILGVQDLTP